MFLNCSRVHGQYGLTISKTFAIMSDQEHERLCRQTQHFCCFLAVCATLCTYQWEHKSLGDALLRKFPCLLWENPGHITKIYKKKKKGVKYFCVTCTRWELPTWTNENFLCRPCLCTSSWPQERYGSTETKSLLCQAMAELTQVTGY